MTTTPTTTTIQPFTIPQFDVQDIFGFVNYAAWNEILSVLGILWSIFSIVAIVVSLLFFVGMVYAKIRYSELSDIEAEDIKRAEDQWAARYAQPETKNARWEVIQQRVGGNTPEAWRIAIIEADILLEETLTNAGYVGQSLGEKLKSANPQSFRTVQDAWDAHKVRNDIAHIGSDFILTQRSAQEAITKYERVFKEFGVI
jgi:uncharacterized membrane protein